MQKAGHGGAVGNGELNFMNAPRQVHGGFLVSAVGKRLGLLGQLIALQVGIGRNTVKIGGVQPVLTTENRVRFVARFLLPEHRLLCPLVDPVAAAIAHYGVVEFAVGTLGLAHDNARLYLEDFPGIDAAPDPHQAIDHAIPVRDIFTIKRGLHRRLCAGVEPTHQRRGFRMLEFWLEENFAEIRLGHCTLPLWIRQRGSL